MKILRGLCVIALALLAGCNQELLVDLDQQQANEVVAVLQKHHINVDKQRAEKGKFKVTVSDNDFPAAVDVLRTYSLPSKPTVEISQIFPSDTLVSTPLAERARLISGVEQRLEQSLRSIDGVISAKVHASYSTVDNPKAAAAPKVAVIINHTGVLNDGVFPEQVKRMMANSFENVSAENISVSLFAAQAAAAGMQDILPYTAAPSPSGVPEGWSSVATAVAGVFVMLALFGAFVFARKKRLSI